MQYLSDPLEKYLLKLVNHEANYEWSKTVSPPIPKVKEEKVENSTMWKHILKVIINDSRQILRELKP